MELLFFCPQSGGLFRSADYEIVAFRGIVESGSGRRRLDARVRLRRPCPLCGDTHEYPAADLPCPLGAEDPDGRASSAESPG